MFNGPGKYDDLATMVRHSARAEGVVLIVHKGVLGSSFCVQAELGLILGLPAMLREIADGIDEQIKAQQREGEL